MSTSAQASSGTHYEITTEAMAAQHISPPKKDLHLSNVNIVIGPNGAGKTRFLRAVIDVLKKNGNYDILYGYFPGLSSSGRDASGILPDFSLEDFMESDDISFNDFFKEIEFQHSSFFASLLTPKSKKKEQDYERLLNAVNESFTAFTGKKVLKHRQRLIAGRKANIPPRLVVEDPQRAEALSLDAALKDFSPGERMLFYMSLFLALKKSPVGGRKQAIILDEPEAHLHPDALLEFVKELKDKFPQAEIWIATHSLFLLSQYKFENIIYLEKGQVASRDSKLYTKILSSMLGPYLEDVQRFFASLPQWQYCDFIAECFLNPDVVDIVDPMDPQVEIFIKVMREKKLQKVLDYGGGSGRLGRSVAAATIEWKNLQYHIFDKETPKDRKGIKVIHRMEEADSDYNCVVMMNVLHEVGPDEWPQLFTSLSPRITDNGCLLFVEVEALQNGEYPNDAGYFLLGPDELRILFCLKNNPTEVKVSKDSKHRGFLIPRDALKAVTKQSVEHTINQLQNRTYAKLKAIRAAGQDQTKAREYAFLLQQHMNAMLYNEKVSGGREVVVLNPSPWARCDD